MKRAIVLALIGFIVGAGGGSAAAYLATPADAGDRAEPASGSEARDSADVRADPAQSADAGAGVDDAGAADVGAADASAAEAGAADASAPTGSPAEPDPAGTARRTTAVGADREASADAVAVEPVDGPAVTAPARASDEAPRRLAQIFGAMDAADAARVLERLEDDEIRSILVHMASRSAAEILGNLDPARAATLSRSVMEAGK